MGLTDDSTGHVHDTMQEQFVGIENGKPMSMQPQRHSSRP